MYRLREERLKSYYITTKESSSDGGAITARKPDASSHAESLSDHGFLTMKAKEIRDSASPTLEFKQSNSCHSSHLDQSTADGVSQSRQTIQQTFSSRTHDGHDNGGHISTTYESKSMVPALPYVDDDVAYDATKSRQNLEKSSTSSYSVSSQRYSTSSKRETTESGHQASNHADRLIRQTNDYGSGNNIDYKIDTVDRNNALDQIASNSDICLSQQRVYQQNDSSSRLRKTRHDERVSSSRQSVYEENVAQPTNELTTSSTEVRRTNQTGSTDDHLTNQESRSSVVRTTNSGDSHTSVDRNIMNELHKLDSYLSTEASSPAPVSPSVHVSEKRISDRTVESSGHRENVSTTAEVHEQSTTQNSYSKISMDVSATHAAFASSLRASPDRSTASPGKRSSSRSSLERSSPEKSARGSPEKSTRGSPEKSSTNDLSKRFTASFQNRISTNVKVTGGKKTASSSDDDSDDSSATYDKRNKTSRQQTKTQISHATTRTQQKQQTPRCSPTKSCGNTSEGSVEREIYRPYAKSPDSSPERSAFRPVRTNIRSTQSVERLKTETRRQSFPQTPATDDRTVKKKISNDERRTAPDKLSKTNRLEDVTSYPASTNHAAVSKSEATVVRSRERLSQSPESAPRPAPAVCPDAETKLRSPQTSKPRERLSPSPTERTSKTATSVESQATVVRSRERLSQSPESVSKRAPAVCPVDETTPRSPQTPKLRERLSPSPTERTTKTATSAESQATVVRSRERLSQSPESTPKQRPATCAVAETKPQSPQASKPGKAASPGPVERIPKTATSTESPKRTESRSTSSASEKLTQKSTKVKDIVDVDEGDMMEEIHVDVTPKTEPLEKVTAAPAKNKKSSSKAPIKKKRSATCGEFSNICNQKSSSTVQEASTSESESSSEDSDSEDEREEVVIEEIIDVEEKPTPKKPASDGLDRAIKTNEEVEREKVTQKEVALIPENKVILDTKGRTEEFIRQERITKEGELDDCLPKIEDVLGKDADRTAIEDFHKWEQEAERKSRASKEKLSPERVVENKKETDGKPKSIPERLSKLNKKEDGQQTRKTVRADSAELRKRESKGNDILSKKLTKPSSRTSITSNTGGSSILKQVRKNFLIFLALTPVQNQRRI